jgi:hypothetical protein
VRDLATGTTRLLATSPGGVGLDWVKGSESTVIYTELSKQLTDSITSTPWKIYAIDLDSDVRQEIATSKSSKDEAYQPLPVIEWPYVVWDQLGASKKDIVVFDLRSKRQRVLMRGTSSSWLTISNKRVVWDDDSGPGRRDVFSASVEGPVDRRQLSMSGVATRPTSGSGFVVWQEPAQGDPRSLWETDVMGATPPAQIAEGGAGNAVIGKNFVAWYGSGATSVMVGGLGETPISVADAIGSARISVGLRLAASGTRLVWGITDVASSQLPESIVIADPVR